MRLSFPRYGLTAVLLIACMLSLRGFSAPYNGDIVELEQPDGTIAQVRFFGDEYYCRGESLDGYTVVRDELSGWIVYADLNQDATEFVPTDVVYNHRVKTDPNHPSFGRLKTLQSKGHGHDKAEKTALKKQLRISKDSRLEKHRKRRQELEKSRPDTLDDAIQLEAAAGDDSYEFTDSQTSPAPLTGSVVGLTVLVEFQDEYQTIPPETIEAYCNQPGYTGYSNQGSVRDYFYGISGGQLEYTNVVTNYIRLDHEKSYYDNCDGGKTGELIDEALNKLCAQGFDFSVLTKNASGWIQAVNFFYAGRRSCGWAKGLWPHKGSKWTWYSCAGTGVGDYQITDIGSSLSLGTFCHENGHMLCGWPDLYDYGGESNGVGNYDLMAYQGSGSNPVPPNPYFRYQRGWETYIDITNAGAGSLQTILANPFNDPGQPLISLIYKNPNNSKEYFLIENSRKIGRRSSMPDEGLLIWHVDESGSNDNEQMTPTQHYRVSVEQADGLFHLENADGYGGSGDLFHAGDKDEFSDFTLPDAKWWDDSNSGLTISEVSAAGGEMSFRMGVGSEPTAYYPLNGNFNDASGSGLNAVGYNFVNPWSSQSFTGSYDNMGSCLAFDGVDDYVQCPAAAGVTAEWTFAMWVSADKYADMVAADKFPAGSGGAGWSVRLTQGGQLAFTIGSQSNNSTLVTPAPVYEPGRWTHVACTFANGTAKIFVNGALRMIRKGIAQTPSTAALNVMLARGVQLDTDLFFQGKMDDVRFYDADLDSGPLSMLAGLNFKPDRSALAILQLEESAGTQALDASGRSCHGTLKNGLTFDTGSTAGAVGQALSFDGVDDYIALNPAAVDKRNDGFTVALWAYPKAVHWWARFIDFGNGSSSDNILLARRESSNDLVFKVYNGAAAGAEIRAANAIELNKWQFFAAAVDSAGSVRIYKNGQLIQSGTTAAPKSIYRSNLYVGRSNWSSDAHYNGAMDDIRIYNCRLSDAEISAIYQNNRMDGPVPFSGADNVSPETVLTFLPALNAVRHDIYFGTEFGAVQSADTLSPEYRGRKTVTSFNPPLLEARREYFWRVDEVLADGTVQKGPVWRFSTIGSIQRQVWTGLPAGDTLSLLKNWADYPDRPSLVTSLDRFEIPSDWDNNYGTRVHGLLVPRTSGSYRFWIAGDNEVELWLGTSADPASAVRIAYISGTWSGPLNFDQIVTQRSAAQSLVANQAYYIMALHKEGDGGDHMAVAWQGPDSPTREIIDAFWLCPPRENESPVFDPSAAPALSAVEGQAFAAALPVGATDPDGQTPIYRRQTGPAWLHVAPDGQLSGTPENADAGVNTFTIRALDEKGGFDDMVVSVDVADRLTGTMGLTDLLGFAHQWLNADVDSPANLDQTTPVDFEDFALLSNNWNADFVDGLVAHWSMDEAAGLTARDSYADFDGTLTNMSEYNWVKGFLGNALAFDGKDDYVEIAGYKGITGGASRTCAAWIKANSPSSQIMNWGSAETGAKWAIRVNENGTLRAEVAGGYIYGTTSLLDGNWHHIAVVLVDDGSSNIDEAVLYVDGYRETEYGGVLSCPVNTIEGASAVIGTNITKSVFFSGLIDQVKVYDRALAADEIALLAGHDLLLSLRFDETQGLTCRDSSIYGRYGVLYGAVNPVRAPGYYNNAIELDGTDDYVEIPDYMGISGGNDRACTAWIKTSDLGGQIISWGNTATGSKWLIRVNEQGQLRAEVQGGYISSSTVIADNSWHHIAVVLKNDGTPDISEAALYVDGRLETDTQWFSCPVNTASEETVKIGVFSLAANPNYYEGCIDDVRIYDRALSAEDVNRIKNDL